jgi:predicted CXXCH cytochrome family protein
MLTSRNDCVPRLTGNFSSVFHRARSAVMTSKRRSKGREGTALTLLFLLIVALPAFSRNETKSGVPVATSTEAARYAGSDACKTCHEDLYTKNFETTPHFKTTLKDGHGCESCHGPGAEHVAAGGDVTKIIRFKELSRPQASARCLSCHGDSHGQSQFSRSAHASNDVGCLDCHSPHHAKEAQRLLTQAQPQLCYGCHTATKADFAKPYHHRVNEGLVQCADCHNLHGTSTLRHAERSQRRWDLREVPRRQTGSIRI